ncbi:MAG: N-acyl-D-amino-acid deacylase family protein [Acidimicrobiales bacterium]
MTFDLVIRNGRWFDGTGAGSAVRDLGIRDGVVAAISPTPLPTDGCPEVIDATGRWVAPGLVDIHTHYDAEVFVNPGLGDSVRHGVTTIVMGSCSLSTILSSPEDCADMFSRVEAVPYDHVLATLEHHGGWSTPAEYIDALVSLPLGPNVSCFLGHSDLRAHVLGLGRSVDRSVKPNEAELTRMEQLLDDALDAGMLGLSTMTTKLDKVGGERFRSRPLPSTHARWSEYRRLNRTLRRRGRVLQSAPDARMPLNAGLFLAESRGRLRPKLKTSLLVAADPKSVPGGSWIGRSVWLGNRVLGSDVRMQHLPVPFELYSDGIDLPVFEELGAGAAALHLRDEVERNTLMRDEGYRRRFREQYARRLVPGLWHKDLYDAEIVGCPDESVVGKTFGVVADDRGIHPVDAFLDLIVEHGGSNVRWRTTVANHRPKQLNRMASDPGVLLGFSDAGAHLRNMAFYNFGLRLLKRVRDAEADGRPFLTLEAAVHRLTGELGEWFGLDAGTLRLGDRADLVVIDPDGLDDSVDAYHEEPIPAFGGLRRMVRRNDAAVDVTCVAGEVVFRRGAFEPGFGETRRTGQFLRAATPQRRRPGAQVVPA